MSDDDLDIEELDGDLDGDLDEDEIGDDLDDDLTSIDDDVTGDDVTDDVTDDEDDEDDEDDAEVPRARVRPGSDDDEDDDVNPDDIEADLDSILKDKIASGEDEEEDDEEEEALDPAPASSERIAAKAANEFTCNTCFLIVHPRQFGRLGNLSCPEGYDPCPSIAKVEAMLEKAKKA